MQSELKTMKTCSGKWGRSNPALQGTLASKSMSKKESQSDTVVTTILEGRQETSGRRFQKLPENVETVDEVLEEVSSAVANALVAQGFRYSKSKLKLSRKLGPITQEIQLERDGNNLSGVYIAATCSVLVKSNKYKTWSKEYGIGRSEYLWVNQLGNLAENSEYLHWQYHDPQTRETHIQDTIKKIKDIALPALELWSSTEKIRQHITKSRAVTRIDWLIDIAIWVGNMEAASHLFRNYLDIYPSHREEFLYELNRLGKDKNAEVRPSTPGQMAFLVTRYGFYCPETG